MLPGSKGRSPRLMCVWRPTRSSRGSLEIKRQIFLRNKVGEERSTTHTRTETENPPRRRPLGRHPPGLPVAPSLGPTLQRRGTPTRRRKTDVVQTLEGTDWGGKVKKGPQTGTTSPRTTLGRGPRKVLRVSDIGLDTSGLDPGRPPPKTYFWSPRRGRFGGWGPYVTLVYKWVPRGNGKFLFYEVDDRTATRDETLKYENSVCKLPSKKT